MSEKQPWVCLTCGRENVWCAVRCYRCGYYKFEIGEMTREQLRRDRDDGRLLRGIAIGVVGDEQRHG